MCSIEDNKIQLGLQQNYLCIQKQKNTEQASFSDNLHLHQLHMFPLLMTGLKGRN